MVFVQLLAMLVLILIAAEVFTNALDHLGEKLGISEGDRLDFRRRWHGLARNHGATVGNFCRHGKRNY